MRKSFSAVIGLAFLVGGGALVFTIERTRIGLIPTYGGLESNYPCYRPIESVRVDRPLLSEGESTLLRVRLVELTQGGTSCEVTISLRAPSFDYEPKDTAMKFTLSAGAQAPVINWVLTSKKLGDQVVVVDAVVQNAVVPLSVVNALGLTIAQVSLLSMASAFLGPALTLPWLLEYFKRRRPMARDDAKPR